MQPQAEVPTQTLSESQRSALAQAVARGRALAAQRQPLRSVLTHLAATVETFFPGTTASILIIDAEGLLRNGASPNVPADFLDAIDRLKPDANVGTCAAAAATGEIVLTPDFLVDSRWAELRHLPLALGWVGAWSQPLKAADGHVLGTFGTYFRERRLPTPQERTVVAALADVAGGAISAQQVA